MDFQINHITEYLYEGPSAEACIEARLTPPVLAQQSILEHTILIDPVVSTSSFRDYFDNRVEFFSLPYRHRTLRIENKLRVHTSTPELPEDSLQTSVQEARQIFSSVLPEVFDYLQPTNNVPLGRDATLWARRYLRGDKSLKESLTTLNSEIFKQFVYRSGSTTNSTPLLTVWKLKRGVCQDFAHIMLSILRTAGLPSRYVCGYLDPNPSLTVEGRSSRLTGSIATHAWVEVLVPGMRWVALDPTNDMWCGERHVTGSYGRDSRDAAPLRGTFKGSARQRMKVKVLMKRLIEKKTA